MSITPFYGAVVGIIALFYTSSIYCNVVWPAIFVWGALQKHLYVIVVISLVIEALCFYWFLKDISWRRALLFSVVGNAVSTIMGTFIMVFAMLGWEGPFGRGSSSMLNYTANFIGMCLGSALIEWMVIYIIFRPVNYSGKQIWMPVLIGNIVTYALTAAYMLYALKTGQLVA